MAAISKRGDAYRITVSLGCDGNGQRIRKYLTYTPPPGLTKKQTEKALQQAAMDFEERCKNGEVLDQNTRFRDFVERWFTDYAEKQLKARTVSRYRELLVRTNVAFGGMKIADIKPFHVQQFYSNLSEKGVRADVKYKPLPECADAVRKSGMTQQTISKKAGVSVYVVRSCSRGDNITRTSAEKISQALVLPLDKLFTPCEDKCLSNSTIHRYHEFLSSIFSTAVEWQVIPSNPCQRVKPPRVELPEERYLDEYQAAELLEALENVPYQYAVMIQVLLYTGLRRGELLGLEWSDIDFFKSLLSVNRSSLYTKEKGIFTDTLKTKKSRRVIRLSDNIVQLLKDFRQYQQEQAAELGDQWHNTNRLFTKYNGDPLHPDTLTRWFEGFVKENKLPDICVHSLRHTNATLQIAAGVNVRTVSSRLGHATTTTTENIYAHAIKSADEAAAEILNDILMPKSNPKAKKIG